MNDLASRISTPITEWKDGARTNYITNHDEAAHVTGGFTGRYPASMMGDDDAWIAKKSKTLGTLSMVSGSSTVDLPQFRLLQKGKFAFDDYAIDWSVIAQNESKHSADFFGDLSKYITENNAFAFHNMNAGIVNHVDNTNKVITILRTDGKKKIYTIINLNHKSFDQGYDFGVDVKGPLKIVLNSDSPKYGGSGQIERTLPNNTLQISSAGMHGKPGRITLPSLPAMSAIVIEGR
jgi:1,4-alpha-glucan branching enzyme